MSTDHNDAHAQFSDAAYMQELQSQMLKFANMQLNDHQLAEDAVQEALIGALKNARSFAGKSAYKTWVFAILKNKIADILRKRHRTVEMTNLAGNSADEDEDFSRLFDERGHWHKGMGPDSWGDPEASFKQDQFWQVFEICLENLPERQAKVFMMREFIGLESDEICNNEDLSVSNLHVILYRARMRLQQCLEMRWYSEGEAYA
ncbi:RNA polymerase factor sigma-70 [Agaribacterium haliotis]|uniref:RNA polymerase factor sigma-70 n=1 Tax=Agaribacterium haliotis TaxID=2013869 RepID=UPI000BB59A0F|nr:RNA polymerase factor sigma-70 [Agaribacterium haliotis]